MASDQIDLKDLIRMKGGDPENPPLRSMASHESFDLAPYLESRESLGCLGIEQDGYYLRSAVNAYLPIESIGSGVAPHVDNCEFKTDLLVVSVLNDSSEIARRRVIRDMILSRFTVTKLRQPCSALMLIALAIASPGKQRCSDCIDTIESTLRAPADIIGQLVVGDLCKADFLSNEKSKVSEKTGFYVQYRSLCADVSTRVFGNIQSQHVVDYNSLERDVESLLDLICQIGELPEVESVPLSENAHRGPAKDDQHLMLAYMNAFT